MSDADDERWLTSRLDAARSGAPAAFDELVRWLEQPLLGFLRSRGADDPHGLANETLLRVFRGIGSFEGNTAQFRAWVFRIARNLLIDEYRRRGRRVDSQPTDPAVLAEHGRTTAMEDRLEGVETVEHLLEGLTDEQREVVLLRVVAGLSVEETAEVVGRRPGAVRALQHRAITTMRRSFSSRP